MVDEWSPEQNYERFGKCSNHNWHGHNYTLHVTVKGHPDPVTGFVVNAKELSAIIKQEVTDHLDHRNLNLDVPFFPKNLQPTSENIVKVIWERLKTRFWGLGGTCINSHFGRRRIFTWNITASSPIPAQSFDPLACHIKNRSLRPAYHPTADGSVSGYFERTG